MFKPNFRTALAFLHDVVASAAAWIIAFWLRFNLEVPHPFDALMLESLLFLMNASY